MFAFRELSRFEHLIGFAKFLREKNLVSIFL